MFLQACVILFTGGGCLPQCMLGYHTPPRADTPWELTPPWEQTLPLGADTPLGAETPQSRHPPPEQTPPQSRHTLPRSRHPPARADTPHQSRHPPGSRHPPPGRSCWEIRSTRGRYASYWNAILYYYSNLQNSHSKVDLSNKVFFSESGIAKNITMHNEGMYEQRHGSIHFTKCYCYC